jgi:ribosomal protein S27AE
MIALSKYALASLIVKRKLTFFVKESSLKEFNIFHFLSNYLFKIFKNNDMAIIESVRCPNCGSFAERHHLAFLAQVKTQCDRCDYLMVTCTRSGRVIEAYAPGLPFENSKAKKLTPLPLPLEKLTETHLEKPQELLSKANLFNKEPKKHAVS